MNIKLVALLLLCPALVLAAPFKQVDLNVTPVDTGVFQRVFGSVGSGSLGVPVAGGYDMDGDGHNDYAFSAMTADVDVDDNGSIDRFSAGQVFLVFGNGKIEGDIDTGSSSSAEDQARILPIYGAGSYEHAGSELWMGEVTGDGLGDLIICRQDYSQNYSGSGSSAMGTGEGAMTILSGKAILKTLAETDDAILDLGNIPATVDYTNLVGANAYDRLCMWARNGDLTGDGQDDVAVAADQEDSHGQSNSGAVYVVRGGAHLQDAGELDLASFGTPGFMESGMPGNEIGNILRVRPTADPSADIDINGQMVASPVPNTSSAGFHLGSSLFIAPLDSGPSELLLAAALNRSGGTLCSQQFGCSSNSTGQGSGGSTDGTTYILWDDNFTGTWIPAPDFIVTDPPGAISVIDGGALNRSFGEELIGGLDYNGDGENDLFVGDLVASGLAGIPGSRSFAGSGHLFYSAQLLKNQVFDFDATPSNITTSSFLGPIAGAISGDTNMHGDFNGDGIADIASSSPHDDPIGRDSAGTLHIFLGEAGKFWPETMDLNINNFPSTSDVKIVNVYGAKGRNGASLGDTLSYSGAFGDIDKDGFDDIITNEMVGDGVLPGSENVGNLILLSGKLFLPDPPVEIIPCEDFYSIKAASGNTITFCL